MSNYLDSVNSTYFFELILTFYDGKYVNQNTEISSSFQLNQGVIGGLNESNKIIKVVAGKMFSRYFEINYPGDIQLQLFHDKTTGIKTANLSLASKDESLKISIQLKNPYESIVGLWRIMIYSICLFWIWVFNTNELINQTK